MFDTVKNGNCNEYKLRHIAMVNLFSAWYILLSLKSSLPVVDPILTRIYLTEYGMNTVGMTDQDLAEAGTEFTKDIQRFFVKCEIQRLENIVDRFGKIGCDPRLRHGITLPVQCKEFFIELMNLETGDAIEPNTKLAMKETQCMDSLLSSMIINNTYTSISRRSDSALVRTSKDYQISPEEMSRYANIIHGKIIALYSPIHGINAKHESWEVKFRKIVDYVKTLVYMTSRDITAQEYLYLWKSAYAPSQNLNPGIFNTPIIGVWDKDELFKCATTEAADYTDANQIKKIVMPYSGLSISQAICLFHNTNAQLDLTKLGQSEDTDAFKFLCCQEYIYNLDEQLKKEKAEDTGSLSA